MRTSFRLIGALLAALAPACSNSNALANASITNDTTSVTLGALVGTPLTTPSGFSISAGHAVRTDLTISFEFAYNVDAAGKPVFLTQSVLGLVPATSFKAGFLAETLVFDSIVSAPVNGYLSDDTVAVVVGDRYVIRSALICSALGVPQYGKIEITALDAVARTVTFKALVNNNCGYRGLSVGIPTN